MVVKVYDLNANLNALTSFRNISNAEFSRNRLSVLELFYAYGKTDGKADRRRKGQFHRTLLSVTNALSAQYYFIL